MFLFKVKFITNPQSLDYVDPKVQPETFCAYVIKGCNLHPDTNPKDWWNNIGKKATRDKVTSLRNDRIKTLKWEYFGKDHRRLFDSQFSLTYIVIFL